LLLKRQTHVREIRKILVSYLVETRVRMDDSSAIRAVAEVNNGSLWLNSAMVFGSGGCPAAVSGGNAGSSLGKTRLKIDNEFSTQGEPVPAQRMIRHLQTTGMSTNAMFEPHVLDQVIVF
jgi:sulfur-oxidizing protein SoxY